MKGYKYRTPQFAYRAQCLMCGEIISSSTMDEFKTLVTRHRQNLPAQVSYSPVWIAKFFGNKCGSCGEPLLEGQECRFVDDEAMHDTCALPIIEASNVPSSEPCYMRQR